ncbi:hypothetical protein PLUTE_a4740 [Pseudoalteromonas luteoviolacea DSM 6061]|nr:hypothetical protein [Pseudoalteromonas luteoviolacea DSM 6061]
MDKNGDFIASYILIYLHAYTQCLVFVKYHCYETIDVI